jgi:hypothetical protein
VASDICGKWSAEHKDTAGSILSRTRTTKRDISKRVDTRLLVASSLGDTKSNLLTINLNGGTRLLGTGKTSINPTKGNSVATDSETTLTN